MEKCWVEKNCKKWFIHNSLQLHEEINLIVKKLDFSFAQ